VSGLIFEKSRPASNKMTIPPAEVGHVDITETIGEEYLRTGELPLPDVNEVEAVRHYTYLSKRAYGVDDGFYPLGSCTMKYNPKIDEWAARLPGLAGLHPYQPIETVQGALQIMYETGQWLGEITGMDEFTLQPAAGAHGEMTGVMMIKAYHNKRGDHGRTTMLVPDSAHGTNPATAHVVGYKVEEVKSDPRGLVDLEDLKSKLGPHIAGLMLTNPNTLGLFEEDILQISELVHGCGGLLYYDGANLNAIMGIARPGDMGFDVVHVNLHKTFGTPHGGGGPGSGPVGVKKHLAEFLPVPRVNRKQDKYLLEYDYPHSIGKVKEFYGNFGVVVKAYTYMRALGGEGLKEASQHAVLNANYVKENLRDTYHIPFDRLCKHEFVATAKQQMDSSHVATLDIAKSLMDYGFHPPTIYFPLIVREAMMIEPPETESRERLDEFIAAMKDIAAQAEENPDLVRSAPHHTVVRRLDEVQAARNPVVRWEEPGDE
jgi:glycine dehydrogenase subunit 2